jgi:Zn-dependent peptidase ImmA (M78 family)
VPEVSSKYSELCWEFAKNVGADCDPEEAILSLTEALRLKIPKSPASSIDALYKFRNIVNVRYLDTDEFDGKLEPLGQDFTAGFQMSLNQRLPSTRLRFTAMHELMHTFFYQYLPNEKFRNHLTDAGEERLCNLGAANLLMPAKELRKQLKGKSVSLETAEFLCSHFGVSLSALILRLKHLKIWNVRLMTWVQLSNGKIVLERSIGEVGDGWSWMESAEIEDAFRKRINKSGHTYLIRRTSNGDREVRPIRYDLNRNGRFMNVLTGPKVTGSRSNELSLFRAKA